MASNSAIQTIYAVGNQEFLVKTLDALAMIFQSGWMDGLALVGFVVGILIMSFQGVMDPNRGLQLHGAFIAIMVYLVAFNTTTDAYVKDLSGQLQGGANVPQKVSNVPVGLVVIGSVTSHIGYGITRQIEQHFVVPGFEGMTKNGYLDPLHVMHNLKKISMGESGFPKGGQTQDGHPVDFKRTVANYLTECTYKASDRGTFNAQKLTAVGHDQPVQVCGAQANNGLEAMCVDKPGWPVKVHIPVGSGGTTTQPNGSEDSELYTRVSDCETAHGAIMDWFNNNYFNEAEEYYNRMFGRQDWLGETEVVTSGLINLQQAARDQMTNSLFENWRRMAAKDYAGQYGSASAARFQTVASEKRQMEWAAKDSLFRELSGPMMAYIEAFFYFLSPIMVFLVALGPIGLSLLKKYLYLPVWMQSWPILLAFSNFYVQHGLQSRLSELKQAADAGEIPSLSSAAGIGHITQVTEQWVAVGSNMAAATPFLSLFIISGSMFALTRMGDMTGGGKDQDTPEAAGTPSQVNQGFGGLMGGGALSQWTAMGGTQATGAQTSKLEFGETLQNQVSSAQEDAKSAQLAYQTELGSQVGRSVSESSGEILSVAEKEEFTQSNGYGQSWAMSEVNAATEGFGLGEEEKTSLAANLSTYASGGLSFQGFGAGVKGSLEEAESLSDTQKQEVQNKLEERFQDTEQVRSEFQAGKSGMDTILADHGQKAAEEAKETDSVSQKAQVAETAQNRVANLQQTSSMVGKEETVDAQVLGKHLSHNEDEWLSQVEEYKKDHVDNEGAFEEAVAAKAAHLGHQGILTHDSESRVHAATAMTIAEWGGGEEVAGSGHAELAEMVNNTGYAFSGAGMAGADTGEPGEVDRPGDGDPKGKYAEYGPDDSLRDEVNVEEADEDALTDNIMNYNWMKSNLDSAGLDLNPLNESSAENVGEKRETAHDERTLASMVNEYIDHEKGQNAGDPGTMPGDESQSLESGAGGGSSDNTWYSGITQGLSLDKVAGSMADPVTEKEDMNKDVLGTMATHAIAEKDFGDGENLGLTAGDLREAYHEAIGKDFNNSDITHEDLEKVATDLNEIYSGASEKGVSAETTGLYTASAFTNKMGEMEGADSGGSEAKWEQKFNDAATKQAGINGDVARAIREAPSQDDLGTYEHWNRNY